MFRKIIIVLSIVLLSLLLSTTALASEIAPWTTKGELLKELGVVSGDASGDLMETKSLNRAELATIICTINGVFDEAKTFTKEPGFIDVSSTDWFYGYVAYCKEKGWLKGTSGTTFSPYSEVNGEMMATVLLRTLGYSPVWGEGWDMAERLKLTEESEYKFIDHKYTNKYSFTRKNAFNFIYDFLGARILDNDALLYEKMGITEEELYETTLYTYEFDYMNNEIVYYSNITGTVEANVPPELITANNSIRYVTADEYIAEYDDDQYIRYNKQEQDMAVYKKVDFEHENPDVKYAYYSYNGIVFTDEYNNIIESIEYGQPQGMSIDFVTQDKVIASRKLSDYDNYSTLRYTKVINGYTKENDILYDFSGGVLGEQFPQSTDEVTIIKFVGDDIYEITTENEQYLHNFTTKTKISLGENYIISHQDGNKFIISQIFENSTLLSYANLIDNKFVITSTTEVPFVISKTKLQNLNDWKYYVESDSEKNRYYMKINSNFLFDDFSYITLDDVSILAHEVDDLFSYSLANEGTLECVLIDSEGNTLLPLRSGYSAYEPVRLENGEFVIKASKISDNYREREYDYYDLDINPVEPDAILQTQTYEGFGTVERTVDGTYRFLIGGKILEVERDSYYGHTYIQSSNRMIIMYKDPEYDNSVVAHMVDNEFNYYPEVEKFDKLELINNKVLFGKTTSKLHYLDTYGNLLFNMVPETNIIDVIQ